MKHRKSTVIDNVYHADFGKADVGEPWWHENFEVENTLAKDALPFFPPTLHDWAITLRSFAIGLGIIGLIGALFFGLGVAVAVIL